MNFFLVDEGEVKFYVYINANRNINKILEYLEKSKIPTIIISIHKPLKGEIDESIFGSTTLKDLYFDNAGFLSGCIKNLKHNYLNRVTKAADRSFKSITHRNGEYTSNDLEDDVFNLFKYIFRTGEKWGKENSGSTLPDGVLGYTTYYEKGHGFKQVKISFIWDCKYHSKNRHYDFDRAEIDKARRYIKQVKESKAIKKFSGELNAYVTICNKVNIKNYSNFVGALYRYRKWNGVAVLLDVEALRKLFEFFRENYKVHQDKHHILLSIFSRLLKRKDNNPLRITETLVEDIISEVSKSNLPPNLDVTSLREHLELDELN